MRVEAQEKENKAKEMKDKLIHAVEQTVHTTKDDKHKIEVKEGIEKQFQEMEQLTLANDALTAQLKERDEQLKEKDEQCVEQETQLKANTDHFIKQGVEANAKLDSIKTLDLEIESLERNIEALKIDLEGMRDENTVLKNSNTELKDTVENYELLQKKVEDDLKISEGLNNYEREKETALKEKEVALKETEIAEVRASMGQSADNHRLEILRLINN
jgi:predicted DNA-binding protein